MTVVPVEYSSGDRTTLRSELWPSSDDWVILVHDEGQDLDAWEDFPAELHGHELTVLCTELRGHGLSDGRWQAASADLDVEAALRYAAVHGAMTTTVIGAGVGAVAALIAAGRLPVTSLALLSPRAALSGHAAADLRCCTAPKLLVAGALDATAGTAAERLRGLAIGWLLHVTVPGADHGTNLVTGRHATGARRHILGSLFEHRGYALLERQGAQQRKD
jgi:alpha-beta hydrolase superfamily lysophospholipase